MSLPLAALMLMFAVPASPIPWAYELDQATRQNGVGIVSRATSSRLHHFVQKLLQPEGSSITVVGLGGSFCAGVHMSDPAVRYLNRLEAALRAWAPASNVTVINSCTSATTPSHTVICLDRYMPMDGVDLVLIDYVANMGTALQSAFDGDQKSYELLLRRVLTWPGTPAVLEVHTIWPHSMLQSFAHGAEDPVNVLSQYYGVPFVSARNALWFQQQDALTTPPQNTTNIDIRDHRDKFHYNPRGHAYIAELILTALENIAADLAARADAGAAPLQARLPLPPALVAPHVAHVRYVQCVFPTELPGLVVQQGSGWIFFADDVRRLKPGFQSFELGAPLVVRVPVEGSVAAGTQYDAFVGYLKSFHPIMGSAAIACTGGCTCNRRVIDGLGTEHFSMTSYAHLGVTITNSSNSSSSSRAPCQLVIQRVQGPTGSVGKWKLQYLVLLQSAGPDLLDRAQAHQEDEPLPTHVAA